MTRSVPQRVPYAIDGWGVGELWLQDTRLVWHELPRAKARAARPSQVTQCYLAQRIVAYFCGERVSFDDVELDGEGWTPFQQDVAGALRRVPYGEVVSYAELARLAGHPRAQRAAGTFCAGNRYPLVLPCHRVVGSHGAGSYGSLGLDYKRRLLALEGVTL